MPENTGGVMQKTFSSPIIKLYSFCELHLMIILSRTNSHTTDFINLVALLDEDLAKRDGDEHEFYARLNKVDDIRNIVVVYVEDKAIGCGSFKAYEPGVVEIKRMFVLPEHRGKGVAAAVLAELEHWAEEEGNNSCVLETGKKQPEAIRLYQKSGYTVTHNYGKYEGVENSVCMMKQLI